MQSLFTEYRSKGLLVDANLLLGYLIGSINPRYLATCHATTRHFGPEDFPLLDALLTKFERVVTTPHVLTEVSNLSGRLPDAVLQQFRILFRGVTERLHEELPMSAEVCRNPDFIRFGVTDTAISMVARSKFLVLTDDVALYGLLRKRGVDVVNFNHVRMLMF